KDPTRSNSASFLASTLSDLLPTAISLLRRGSHTISSATSGLISPYSQADWVPSSNVRCILPDNPLTKSLIFSALVSMIASATRRPDPSSTATTVIALCTSIPTYLSLFIGCSFRGHGVFVSPPGYHQKGRPFIYSCAVSLRLTGTLNPTLLWRLCRRSVRQSFTERQGSALPLQLNVYQCFI